jgi:hypothetical protein
MKTRFFVFGLLLILAVALFWLLHKHAMSLTETVLKKTNAPPVVHVDQTPSNAAPTPFNVDRNSPEQMAKMFAEMEKRKQAMAEKVHNEWKTPIEFYGRVIDESNNVVSDANVDYSCNDTSPTGTSYYHMTSDANGFFSFKGIQGKLLEVDVSKEGYYSYDPHGQFFNYAGENQNFVPDAGNPVVFRLRKKGEGADLIKADFPPFAHIAQLKGDGTLVELDLYQGKQASAGGGQLKLEFHRDPFNKNARIYNWNLQLKMSGGGFVGTEEEFPFNAPESNYQSSIVFDMPTNNPDWQGKVNTNYYFQLPDGKYGRMSFEFLPWNGVYTIHSFINPSGSRNLEP